LDVNADRITEMIDESLAAVEAASKENVESFTAGIADAGDDPFTVPESEVELNGESTEQDIGKAAVAAAFAAANLAELKENIWKEVEAHLDKQIEAMEEEKRPDKDEIAGSKKDIKERDVDAAVDSAFSDKQAELEASYDPEPVEEEKPADDEKAEDNAEDAKEEEAAEENADDKPADDAAEEEAAADDGAKEEAPAEEEAAKEPAAEEAAADEPAEEEAAADEPADEPAEEPAAEEEAAE